MTSSIRKLREAEETIAALRAECDRLRDGYRYLQMRLESLGYHAWAHDHDRRIGMESPTGSDK